MKILQLWKIYRFWMKEGRNMSMKGWRTLGFNILTAVAGFLGTATTIPGLDPQTLLIVNVVGNMLLRWVTTGPVGTKG